MSREPANRRNADAPGDQQRDESSSRNRKPEPEWTEDIQRIADADPVKPGGSLSDDAPDDPELRRVRSPSNAGNTERLARQQGG